ncbi:MAG: radical SAM protein [Elusimicrobia bacterium]|nr:radical SAM protein [Elusimicrobiota bacterium]
MKRGKITFTWDIHLACNYRCPYCWFHGQWEELKKNNKYPEPEKLIGHWKRIRDKYGRVMITVAGGEPLIYPGYQEIFEALSGMHDIEITSNLSLGKDELERFIDRIRSRDVRISASYHPGFARFEEFVEKAGILNKHGMLGNVLYLAYPPQLEKIPGYKAVMNREGLHFSVLTFWGRYEGKDYPASYTDREKEIIGLSLGERSGEKFQVEPKRTAGRLCKAGHTYAVIHPDGEVFRCGGGGVGGKNVKIGNFFDEDFALLDGPMPCHSEICPCNEWAFLLVKDEKE